MRFDRKAALPKDLHVVHRRGDRRVAVHQPVRSEQPVFEVGVAAAFSESSALSRHADTAGDDQIDRRHLIQRHRPPEDHRAFDRRGLPQGLRIQPPRIELDERLHLGELWHRHVDDLARHEGGPTHRSLRGVRVALQRRRVPEHRRPQQPLRRCLRAFEVRYAPHDPGEASDLRVSDRAPAQLASSGLVRIRHGAEILSSARVPGPVPENLVGRAPTAD